MIERAVESLTSVLLMDSEIFSEKSDIKSINPIQGAVAQAV